MARLVAVFRTAIVIVLLVVEYVFCFNVVANGDKPGFTGIREQAAMVSTFIFAVVVLLVVFFYFLFISAVRL